MPLYFLDCVFLQFSFSNRVFMFLLHYTCSVLRSRNSRKALKFLSKRLVLLLYGINIVIYALYRQNNLVPRVLEGGRERTLGTRLYTKQRICGRGGVPGVGNCLFLPARGWGIDRQMRTKLQIPGGMPGGDMVTSRIEPCIKKTQLPTVNST